MDRPRLSPLSLLAQALLALAASALLLALAFVAYVEYWQPGDAKLVEPLAIPGKRLQLVYGTGRAAGDALEITGYQSSDDGQIAIAARRGEFSADDFPLLQYGLAMGSNNNAVGPKVDLIWRLAAEPGTVKSMALSDTGTGSAWLDMAHSPDWHGLVSEIGIYATADGVRQSLSVANLTLEPRSGWGLLRSYWHDWTQYRGWSVSSINFLYGTVEAKSLSPVVVAAAWSALAIFLLWIAGRRGAIRSGAALALLLIVWISLDLLWQHELGAQLARTRQQFAGKTQEEKHLADIDADIYRYVQRLKRDVLPAQVSRIVILHNSHGHNFERLKAQYYLLPNNSFNFGRKPPDGNLHNVDYVLVLGEVPDVEFHADTGSLQWRHGHRTLPVQRVDSDPMGNLYRVIPSADSGKGST
jgi:hypothetical protein